MTIAVSGKSSSSKAVRDKISYSPSARSVTVGFAACFSRTPLQWKRRLQNYRGYVPTRNIMQYVDQTSRPLACWYYFEDAHPILLVFRYCCCCCCSCKLWPPRYNFQTWLIIIILLWIEEFEIVYNNNVYVLWDKEECWGYSSSYCENFKWKIIWNLINCKFKVLFSTLYCMYYIFLEIWIKIRILE